MGVQVVLPREGLRAGLALEGSPGRVLPHVHSQVGLLSKGTRAHCALKRLLTRVYTHVGLQMALPVQLAEANGTCEPLLWPAGTFVLLQEHSADIRAEAVGAFVLCRRCQSVAVSSL